jgi:hypothetical protein
VCIAIAIGASSSQTVTAFGESVSGRVMAPSGGLGSFVFILRCRDCPVGP